MIPSGTFTPLPPSQSVYHPRPTTTLPPPHPAQRWMLMVFMTGDLPAFWLGPVHHAFTDPPEF